MMQCRVSFRCGWCDSFARDEVNRRRSNSGTGCDLVSQFMNGGRHGEIKGFSSAWREGGRGGCFAPSREWAIVKFGVLLR